MEGAQGHVDVTRALREAIGAAKATDVAEGQKQFDLSEARKLHRELGALLDARTVSAAHRDAEADAAVVTSNGKHGLGEQTVVDAVHALRRGEIIVVTDDEDRENEGDLIFAAEHATAETVAFTVRYTSGVICASMPPERIDELKLPPMVSLNEDPKGTAFTVSVDAREGTTTGISAGDRAITLRQLADPARGAADFNRPGHVFPLRCREGGVLAREGHTEATVDFMLLAGLRPCGALCEIVSADSVSMARMPELRQFAREHGLVLTTIADLVAYRSAHGMEREIRPIAE